ncbi:putative zinc protease [bioreactor metagenome]|uniref:Putative zinc protease n=1 Tax=bioreactor metagenome TaxID=1076179 RepID=A0A644X1T8_9ZZZZ
MYEQMTLPNGVRILTEHIPGVRSAALGFWVGTGSRHEKASESGAAHFIEHMIFKGTDKRTAAKIAQETDAIGGQINAYTTKEYTCFYAQSLDIHLRQALDILWDMTFSSRFDERDVTTERGVILEEIGMYRDNPEDLCAERLFSAIYKGTALARPILGRPATLNAMTGSFLKAYQKENYRAAVIIVTLAGSFDDSVLEELKERFSTLDGGPLPPIKSVTYTPGITVKRKATEQNHLTLAFASLPYGDDRRFALQLLSSILGGGMSSRLFQEVREKQGLCYSVYSYGAGHAETGVLAVYAALGRETEHKALATICRVVREFAKNGPEAEELSRAREQSKANVLMGLESTQARMSHLGRSSLLTGKVMSPDEIIAAYDAVTREQVQALAKQLFDFEAVSLSAVGKVGTEAEYRAIIENV